jgi:hypothetical protein
VFRFIFISWQAVDEDHSVILIDWPVAHQDLSFIV